MRISIKAKMTIRALELMLNKLDKLATNDNDNDKIEILNNSIMNSWKGIFELKGDNYGNKNTKGVSKTGLIDHKDVEVDEDGW